jgi:hypothetical protein
MTQNLESKKMGQTFGGDFPPGCCDWLCQRILKDKICNGWIMEDNIYNGWIIEKKKYNR